MKNLKARAGLTTFVRRECANYVSESCVYLEDDCHVLSGKVCSYFEKAVLGPPNYPYKTPGYDWNKIFEEYGQINEKYAGRGVTVRRCGCGNILEKRQRYCDKCKIKKRSDTYRKRRESKKLLKKWPKRHS